MRLVDITDFFKRLTDHETVSGILTKLSKQPTIDPVHAAGACYCGECGRFYSPEKPWGRFGECRRCGVSRPVMHTDFCSKGEPKEETP